MLEAKSVVLKLFCHFNFSILLVRGFYGIGFFDLV